MKPILDMCCGSRMFYFDKQDDRVLFNDIRAEEHILCDGRILNITPDVISDFKNLPLPDNTFYQVLFDPPHLIRVGKNSWMFKKYGALNKDSWREDLSKGFSEAFRVLRPGGTLLFKWNETQIPVKQILALTDQKPTAVQRVGKNDKTHWIYFLKELSE
ncbi:TPA: class I SAM-dependent methyltransferase [Proteus mirabilis]|nr:class I SAM-dependent methyltransferase [Proteus mirabilis]HEJ9749947.1 class I SAM-dependent methyltransferase [Proteus mirabilis]